MMHQALNISGVLTLIFEAEADKAVLGRAAQCSKTCSSLALDVLWRYLGLTYCGTGGIPRSMILVLFFHVALTHDCRGHRPMSSCATTSVPALRNTPNLFAAFKTP